MFFFGPSSTNANNKSGNQSSTLNAGAVPAAPAKPIAVLSTSQSPPLKPSLPLHTSASKHSLASTTAPSPKSPITPVSSDGSINKSATPTHVSAKTSLTQSQAAKVQLAQTGPKTPLNQSFGTKTTGLFRGLASNDKDDFLAHGFLDERRRTNLWATTETVMGPRPVPYALQKGAWLKAFPLAARKHPLAPKEPKAAKLAKPAAAPKVGTSLKKASVKNAPAKNAKSTNKKAPAKKFTYVRPAPRPLPPGPMNGPFAASFYKLVNVYIRVPGPFATAGENDDCIAQGFFDERRRTAAWAHTVPSSSIVVKYQAQPTAWLKAYPQTKQAVKKAVNAPAPAKAIARPQTAPAKAMPATKAPAKQLAPKTAAPTTTGTAKPTKKSPCTAMIVYTRPKSFMAMAAAVAAKQRKLTGPSTPNYVFPKQKQLTNLEKREANNRKSVALTKRNVPQLKTPGPLVGCGDTKASLPHGFFDEQRLKHVSHWDGIAADRVEEPLRYVPQPKAWLRAAKEYVRPECMRAAKEPKARRPSPPKKIYVQTLRGRTYSSVKPSTLTVRTGRSTTRRGSNASMSKEVKQKINYRPAARRSVQQPTRRH